MASLLPVLVYFEGTVQLRNIHILAGVSRLAGQEGVVERNGQSTVKRKKRASRSEGMLFSMRGARICV